MSRFFLPAIILSIAGLFFATLLYSPPIDAAPSSECSPIEIIFARGSGETIEDDTIQHFRKQLDTRVKPSFLYNIYELGSESQNGHQYPAEKVNEEAWMTGAGAWLSAGYGNKYGDSVQEGVYELIQYVVDKSYDCPDSKFVFAGYSQGAQVIGQYLRVIDDTRYLQLRSRIIYVALFGDPKLHLPEGEGVSPPACRGEQFSKYRRQANCHVDNGSLGARKPYLPPDMHDKTGLWCYDHDFICGSSKLLQDNNGHETYTKEGGAIDQAAREAAVHIKTHLSPDLSRYINVSSAGNNGIDTVFVLGTNPIAPPTSEEFATFATENKERFSAINGRVALVDYYSFISNGNEEEGYNYAGFNEPRTVSPLTANIDTFSQQVGGDIRLPVWLDLSKETTLRALSYTLDNLQWRSGSDKVIVLVTDATSIDDPDRWNNSLTVESVLNRAREIGSIKIHVLATQSVVPPALEYLSSQTGGKSYAANPVVARTTSSPRITLAKATLAQSQDNLLQNSLEAILVEQEGSLRAQLRGTDYRAPVGTILTFDASPSYSESDPIVKYQWDFNDDGTIDRTTTTPVTKYAYSQDYTGVARVTIVTQKGLTASTTASILIGEESARAVRLSPPKLVVTKDDATSATIQWSHSDTSISGWFLTVNGVPIGRADRSRTSTTVTDLIRSEDVELSVAALSSKGEVGEYATVVLPALNKSRVGTPNPLVEASEQNLDDFFYLAVTGKPRDTTDTPATTRPEEGTNNPPQPSSENAEEEKLSMKQHWSITALAIASPGIIGGAVYGIWRYRMRKK